MSKEESKPYSFKGDNAKLVSSIKSLLALDSKGALVPNGVCGLARQLLESAAERLTAAEQRNADRDTEIAAQVESALRRSFSLGQVYWQQADSDSTCQQNKSDQTMETQAQHILNVLKSISAALKPAEYRGPFPACPPGEVVTALEWNVLYPSGVVPAGTIAQQKCETCHDQGEVFVSKGEVEYGMLTEPEPIYKPCPDCAEPANKESAQ